MQTFACLFHCNIGLPHFVQVCDLFSARGHQHQGHSRVSHEDTSIKDNRGSAARTPASRTIRGHQHQGHSRVSHEDTSIKDTRGSATRTPASRTLEGQPRGHQHQGQSRVSHSACCKVKSVKTDTITQYITNKLGRRKSKHNINIVEK